jgi:hypothetical protein
MKTQKCPHCGMENKRWSGNLGDGYEYQDKLYCCKGCAEVGHCTCPKEVEEELFHIRQESP